MADDIVKQAEIVVTEYDAFWEAHDAFMEEVWLKLDIMWDNLYGDEDA